MAKIIVQNTEITVLSQDDKDYISLTDMANGKQSESRAADIIKNWIRTRYTIEFLGTWEMIHNPNFKVVEFDHFKMQAGLPNFVMSVSEWIEKTNAIGIIVKKWYDMDLVPVMLRMRCHPITVMTSRAKLPM